MGDTVNILCTALARGGSKGVPGKNLREIAGKPLIAHTLDQARASGLFEAIAVSSDSREILAAAERFGADVLVKRPDELATDGAPKGPATRHCVEEAEKRTGRRFDCVVDLDCTSPLRLSEDIVGAVELWRTSGGANVITGAPARRSPYFNLVERGPDGIARLSKSPDRPIHRRQDAPECFDMNASIYVWSRDAFMKNPDALQDDTRIFVMPEERSIDIDSELDLEFVSYLMRKRRDET